MADVKGFIATLGNYLVWVSVMVFHGIVLWDLGTYILDDTNWQPKFDAAVAPAAATALKKFAFIETQRLSDEKFRAQLYERAAADCSGCGLVPYPGYEKAKATLQALTSAGVRQRYELWHSIALLSCILIWILNFVMMSLSTRILTQGPLFYVSVAIFFVPFLALLFAVTTPTGDILNFTSDIPHLQGVGLHLLYFAAGFPLVGWPLSIWIYQHHRIQTIPEARRVMPNPFNYRPPRERLEEKLHRKQ